MVWTMRIGLLTLFGTLLYIYVLNLVRFFRPSNIREVITGPLPRLRQVGGKIAGVEATASLVENDATVTAQLAEVKVQIRTLAERLELLAAQTEMTAGGETDEQA